MICVHDVLNISIYSSDENKDFKTLFINSIDTCTGEPETVEITLFPLEKAKDIEVLIRDHQE
jgi:hypothetical protein